MLSVELKISLGQIIVSVSLSCHINVVGNYCSRTDGDEGARDEPRGEQTMAEHKQSGELSGERSKQTLLHSSQQPGV